MVADSNEYIVHFRLYFSTVKQTALPIPIFLLRKELVASFSTSNVLGGMFSGTCEVLPLEKHPAGYSARSRDAYAYGAAW